MVTRPGGDIRAAALENGDVERVDAYLLQDFCLRGASRLKVQRLQPDRFRLPLKPLKSPVAASLNFRWHAGQRNQGAKFAAAALELERRHVVLDTFVIAGQGRGASEVDGAVRTDQAGAGGGRARRMDQQGSHHQRADGRGY